MIYRTMTTALAAAALTGASGLASAEQLDRDATGKLMSGATGTHYYLDHKKWYNFNWGSGGKLVVTKPNAKADEKPYAKGTWRIKEVKKEKGMSDADVAAANAALHHVYCHTLDTMWSGNEICWEVHRVSDNKDANKKLLPKQTYKVYRGEGAETGEYVITRG